MRKFVVMLTVPFMWVLLLTVKEVISLLTVVVVVRLALLFNRFLLLLFVVELAAVVGVVFMGEVLLEELVAIYFYRQG